MNERELAELLDREGEAAERNPDAPIKPGTKIADGPGRSSVYSLEVVIEQLVDSRAGSRIALLVDLVEQTVRVASASAAALGPGGITSTRLWRRPEIESSPA